MSNFTRLILALPMRGSSVFIRLLSAIFLVPAAVFLSAWSFQEGEEKVTIKGDDVPLITVFKSMKKQTGYDFFYASDLLDDRTRVNVDVKNVKVDDVLRKVLGRDYVWVYNENAVSITKKKEEVRRGSLAAVRDSSVAQITVSGQVTDARGMPIPGATVMVKGTRDGASTDENGKFSLPGVTMNAVLVISSVGFEKREISVKGKTLMAKLNVSMSDLDEAVVVAYNTTTQRANTGAATVVKGSQIQSLPNRSFDRSLQGMVPGLLITNGNGQPGGGVSNMVLRGISTGADPVQGSTVRNPLIVIDGVPVSQEPVQLSISFNATSIGNPMAQLNPSDIETITVLKDAAAIALYGSKASNGVILVTTKKGAAGRTVFSFRHQTDIASRLKGKAQFLNQEEYLDLLRETYSNSGFSETDFRNDLFSKFPYKVSGTDTSFYSKPDWVNNLYNEHALTTSNELSASGGNEKSRFYLNLEYTKQSGIVKNTGYDRKSLRFNFEHRPISAIKFGINTAFSYNVQDYSNTVESGNVALVELMSPLNPVRLEDGNYMLNYKWGSTLYGLTPNPAAAVEYNTSRNTSYRGLGKAYVEVGVLKDFILNASLGADFVLTESKEKNDPRLATEDGLGTGIGRISESDIRRANIISTNILRYDKVVGKDHAINVLVGQEAQILQQRSLLVIVQGLELYSYDQINSPGVTIQQFGGATNKETLLSFFGQANYAFRNKYFFSSSLRRDGSSRFGEHRRFGTYWSSGIGWVLSEEDFMKTTSSWVNYLKLRGSVGAAGSSAAVDRFTRYDVLQTSTFLNNTAVFPGSRPGNPNIQWEQTFTWDVGLELRLFKDRISVTTDYYRRNTSDLVYQIALAQNTGYSNVLANIGKMTNKGIEVAISTDILRNEEFRWNLSANWSKNVNKLVKANVPAASLSGGLLANKEGENFNSFYLVRWAGVNPNDGTPQWYDGAGHISSSYSFSLDQRVNVGKPQPDGFGSITNVVSFKGIELSAMLYYQYGFKIYDESLNVALSDGAYPFSNQVRQALDRWKKPGDVAANPRRLLNNFSDGGFYPSTRYLFDGDFIRLKNISLSYNIPGSIIRPMGLSMLKCFVQANNLAIWTKYPGQDPENANVFGNTAFPYPGQRSFSIGLNASF